MLRQYSKCIGQQCECDCTMQYSHNAVLTITVLDGQAMIFQSKWTFGKCWDYCQYNDRILLSVYFLYFSLSTLFTSSTQKQFNCCYFQGLCTSKLLTCARMWGVNRIYKPHTLCLNINCFYAEDVESRKYRKSTDYKMRWAYVPKLTEILCHIPQRRWKWAKLICVHTLIIQHLIIEILPSSVSNN